MGEPEEGNPTPEGAGPASERFPSLEPVVHHGGPEAAVTLPLTLAPYISRLRLLWAALREPNPHFGAVVVFWWTRAYVLLGLQ